MFVNLEENYVLISLDTFRKYRYADVKKGRTEIRECDYDSTQYKDKDVTEKMKLDRLKYLSLFVAETLQEIERLIEIFSDLEGVRRDINEYMERPEEVLSMFSEVLKKRSEASDKLSAEKDAEIARLKRQLKEQNK